MAAYSITQAKARLSELIDRALAGEEVIITRYGKPIVRLLPVTASVPTGGPADLGRPAEHDLRRT